MFTSNNHICIIGGGVSGIFTLCNLIDLKMENDDLSPLHITLIEKNNQLGEGMAYRDDYASNLLNTAAGLFSEMDNNQQFCLKNQPSFLKWVRENESAWRKYCPTLKIENITKNAYLPRLLVGIYMRHLLQFYTKLAPTYHVIVRVVAGEAHDICRQNLFEWTVTLSDKRTWIFSHVVLALGGFLKENFSEFEKHESFLNRPWPTTCELKKILNCKTVGIMGSKLSALDTVAILNAHDFKGKIVMASRSGFLPSVKNVHHAYKPFLLTKDTLQQLMHPVTKKIKLNDILNLVKSEIEYASQKKINWGRIFADHHFSMSWLLWQVKMAKNPNTLWNSLLATASDFFMDAWHCLDNYDKHYFKKHFGSIWDIYRFSMPLCTANEVVDALRSEKLMLLSQLSSVKYKLNSYCFNGFDIHLKKWTTVETDCLINATGVNYSVDKINSTLIKNLLRRGVIESNVHDGILMNEDHITVFNQTRCYALGDLTRGTFFYTNSYLFCVNQAAEIAKTIYEDVNQRRYSDIYVNAGMHIQESYA